MAIDPPRSKVGPQPLCGPIKVLTATESARLEDQTVPYVGELPTTFKASEKPYPRVNTGAVNVVRALLDSTVRVRRDRVSLAQVVSSSELPTLRVAEATARGSVRQKTSLSNRRPAGGARSADPFVGRVIGGRYTLCSLLASGGMGRVYRAEQSSLGRTVAVKIFESGFSADPNASKRFFREAACASKLRHPNTVKIFDYGVTDDNVCYIAMELLAGRTLGQARRDEGPFTAERATHIARQICRSLAEAHALGVIHRDLKPSNIHLGQHGDEPDFVKVLDFGLVKELEEESESLTQTGLFMGSPQYASPEQIRGKAIDARTDIYSLGVVMHEMLTGNLPFQQEGSFDMLMAHLHEPVPEMDERIANHAGPELQAIVKKCMAKAPAQRYDSMDQLQSALAGVAGPRSVRASTPRRSTASIAAVATPSGTARPQQSRSAQAGSRAPWTLALLTALLLAGLLLLPSRIHESPSQAQRAEGVPAPETSGRASPPAPYPLMSRHSEAVLPWSGSTQVKELDF